MAVCLTRKLSGRLSRFLSPVVLRASHAGACPRISASRKLSICLTACTGAGIFLHYGPFRANVNVRCSDRATTNVRCSEVPVADIGTRLHVVLDIDETLIRSQIIDDPSSDARAQDRTDVDGGFELHLPGGCVMWVVKRPGMDAFIHWLRQQGFDISLYSAGTRLYVEALLPRLDPEALVSQYLCRDDCVRMPSFPNVFLKDLRRVRSVTSEPGGAVVPVDLARTVLVDNNPISFMMQPKNGILVSDWLGLEPDDAEFERVKALLLELEKVGRDVRVVLPILQQLGTEGASRTPHTSKVSVREQFRGMGQMPSSAL